MIALILSCSYQFFTIVDDNIHSCRVLSSFLRLTLIICTLQLFEDTVKRLDCVMKGLRYPADVFSDKIKDMVQTLTAVLKDSALPLHELQV